MKIRNGYYISAILSCIFLSYLTIKYLWDLIFIESLLISFLGYKFALENERKDRKNHKPPFNR